MASAVERVRDEALEVGRGWSGPDAPASWALTAALFNGLAADGQLQGIAAEIPAERLPALLFVASVSFLARQSTTDPFGGYFPTASAEASRPVDAEFAEHYRRFCRQRQNDLASTWGARRYQMTEVARSTQVALALGVLRDVVPDVPVSLVDVGTGAGFGLFPDRYGYELTGGARFGDPRSPVQLHCAVEGSGMPRAFELPRIRDRVGIDANPIDLDDAAERSWLEACAPPERHAQLRSASAAELVRDEHPTIVRGDALDVVADVLGSLSDTEVICVIDSYTAVFFSEHERRRFREVLASFSEARIVAWISLDPLVPLGTRATRTVHGALAPGVLVEENRRGGVFGVLLLTVLEGSQASTRLLAAAHPSGTRMTWLDAPLSSP